MTPSPASTAGPRAMDAHRTVPMQAPSGRPAGEARDPLRPALDDLLTRTFYSAAGYVFESAPYVVPEDAEVLAHVGDLYRATNRAALARTYYERALQIDPALAEVREKLDSIPATSDSSGSSPSGK